MKAKILSIVCFFLISVTQAEPVRTVITGTIHSKNSNPRKAVFTLCESGSFGEVYQDFSISLIAGEFFMEFDVKEPQIISIQIDDKDLISRENGAILTWVFLERGDSLHIDARENGNGEITEVVFTGKGSEKQKFMEKLGMDFKRVNIEFRKIEILKQAQAVFDYRNKYIKLIDDHVNANYFNLSHETLAFIKPEILSVFHMEAMRSLTYRDLTIRENIRLFYEQEHKYPMHNLYIQRTDQLPWSSAFVDRAIISYVITRKVSYAVVACDKVRVVGAVNEYYQDKALKSRIIADYLFRCARQSGWTDDLEKAYLFYNQIYPDADRYKHEVSDFITSLQSYLKEGVVVKNYQLGDTLGNSVSLEDFRGKVVLLDFMFTGCGGCAQVAPSLEQLEAELPKGRVIFISISIDANMETFKKGMNIYSSPSSYKLYTQGKGTSHPIIKDFKISAYPTLILIGKDGKMIAGRAPRPDEPGKEGQLRKMIEAALL